MSGKFIQLEKLTEYGSKEAVMQNLRDAGCRECVIECCLSFMKQGKKKELLQQLEEQRRALLQRVHEEEKQINCLDYLVYQIRRWES